ncbi:MAG: response regulator transcription factor [Burkholderiaceae bacterium]
MTRVLIVDDHPLVARATANEVRTLRPLAETRIAGSIDEAEHALADWQAPDVILLDLRLPDTDGLSGLNRLHRLAPNAAIAIVSAETDPHVMRDAFAQGARGYLTKSTDIERFTESLRKVLDYGFYFPPEATEPAPPIHRSRLTDREAEVIKALASGKVNKQLADMLGVSESTFKTHLRAIYKKLGVRTRVQAAGRARDLGLLAARTRA